MRRVLSENSIILGYLVSYCQHGIYTTSTILLWVVGGWTIFCFLYDTENSRDLVYKMSSMMSSTC